MNEIVYGKLSSKSQTVIPKSVRKRLGLKPGDVLRFRVTDERVTLEKAPQGEDDPFATGETGLARVDDVSRPRPGSEGAAADLDGVRAAIDANAGCESQSNRACCVGTDVIALHPDAGINGRKAAGHADDNAGAAIGAGTVTGPFYTAGGRVDGG